MIKKTVFPRDLMIHDLYGLPIYSLMIEGRDADKPIEMVPRSVIRAMSYYGMPEVKAVRYKRSLERLKPELLPELQLDQQGLGWVDVVQEFQFEGEADVVIVLQNWETTSPIILRRKVKSGELLNWSYVSGTQAQKQSVNPNNTLLRKAQYIVKCDHPVTAVVIDYEQEVERSYVDVVLHDQGLVQDDQLL